MNNPPAVPARNPATTPWFYRNWKWLVPSLVLVMAAFVAGIIFLVLSLMKSSDPYKVAVDRASHSPAVSAALGQPVTPGIFVLGNVHYGSPTSTASLMIPISGPKGQATVRVWAVKSDGVWHYRQLFVVIAGSGQSVNLSDP